MDVCQYSIPTMRTTGRVVVDGHEHVASGTSWFDRQWQRQRPGPPAGRWTWMDLNLSNGWHVSLWDAVGRDGGREGWVTVVDATGAHLVADLVPLHLDAGGHWQGGPGRGRFPTRWVVRVPDLGVELDVEAVVPGQVLRGALGERFEGASAVRGVVAGHGVEGHCYVEMVGDWKG
jgi:predicted secreted hydrolase